VPAATPVDDKANVLSAFADPSKLTIQSPSPWSRIDRGVVSFAADPVVLLAMVDGRSPETNADEESAPPPPGDRTNPVGRSVNRDPPNVIDPAPDGTKIRAESAPDVLEKLIAFNALAWASSYDEMINCAAPVAWSLQIRPSAVFPVFWNITEGFVLEATKAALLVRFPAAVLRIRPVSVPPAVGSHGPPVGIAALTASAVSCRAVVLAYRTSAFAESESPATRDESAHPARLAVSAMCEAREESTALDPGGAQCASPLAPSVVSW
jgi:hypothetical protein